MNLRWADRLSIASGLATVSSAFGDGVKTYAPMLCTTVHSGTELLFMLWLNQKVSPHLQPSDRQRLTFGDIMVFSYFHVNEDVITLATWATIASCPHGLFPFLLMFPQLM
jgi:hypothetical protein